MTHGFGLVLNYSLQGTTSEFTLLFNRFKSPNQLERAKPLFKVVIVSSVFR